MATIVTRSGKGSALTHAEVDANFNNLNTEKIERTGSIAFTGKQSFSASSTSGASFNIPHGTAPTTPADGDSWSTTSGLFLRVNGTVRQFADLDQSQTLSNKTLTTPVLSGVRRGFVSVTSAYTALTTVSVISCSATTAAFSVTLPTAVNFSGLVYTIKKVDSSVNAVTVATTSSQTIDGAATFSLATQWSYVTVVSNGSNWLRIG